MDIAEQAEQHEARERAAIMTHRRKEGPTYKGVCLNCGYEVEFPRRWCDADCRDEWAQREDK